MPKVKVVGAGRMGQLMARKLFQAGWEVMAYDAHPAALETLKSLGIATYVASWEEVPLQQGDYFLSALPGSIGWRWVQKALSVGAKGVDISFFPESVAGLEKAAHSSAVVAVDVGLAPGITHMLTGFLQAQKPLEKALFYVGGLPQKRLWPTDYQVVFSLSDVIDEYVRPVHLRRNGKEETLPPLSELELRFIPELGTLEAFLTDGLRSLLRLPIPTLMEKTLRYPGHAQWMAGLKALGFFSEEPIEEGIVPRGFTEKILGRAWKQGFQDQDIVVLEMDFTFEDGENRLYRLVDFYDTTTGTTAMARTTVYPALGVFFWIAQNDPPPGLYTPEKIGTEIGAWESVQNFLRQEGLQLTQLR
ncbi:MAG: saccharopine dehydrogenase C-terminal domain-containing protein [Bacteroidia bacterium]